MNKSHIITKRAFITGKLQTIDVDPMTFDQDVFDNAGQKGLSDLKKLKKQACFSKARFETPLYTAK